MIHKWMESLFDTLLYLFLVMGLLFFSVCYWKDAYQTRCAELVLEEFLNDVSVAGSMSLEEYEGFLQRIQRINSAYDVELTYSNYMLQPCYAQIPEEQLDQYYMAQNKRKEFIFQEFEANVEGENAELLHFQTETNASLMAAEGEYLPLPDEKGELQVEAVRRQQEVYEGEELITICRVTSEKGSYYIEAETICAVESGTVMLEVMVESELYNVPIEVICYPRVVTCTKGHAVVNTKEVIEKWKQSGKIKCLYCGIIPETIQCNTSIVNKRTGTKLGKEEVWLEVVYLDGHMEIVTPEEKEWQDDYDENYCGIQPVVIYYRGKKDTITVISENGSCKQCGKPCSGRCFSDYINFPYCTKCMSESLLFTGEVYEEERTVKSEELVASLDREGVVIWRTGDMINAILSKNERLKTMQQKIIKRDGMER